MTRAAAETAALHAGQVAKQARELEQAMQPLRTERAALTSPQQMQMALPV